MRAWVLITAAMIAAPATAATNLVANGDFEANPGVVQLYTPGQSIGGWTVTGIPNNGVFVLSNGYNEPAVNFTSQSGQSFLDITGAGNAGLTAGVFQDVATTAGSMYNINFWLGNATGSVDGEGNSPFYTGPSSLTLLLNGSNVGTFTNSQITSNGVNWQQLSFNFTATGATTRIGFQNATTSDSFVGLDSVNVAAVPEPSTWAMMLGGLLSVGSVLRRRRRMVPSLTS